MIEKFLPYLEDIRNRFYSSSIIILIFFLLGVFSSASIVKIFIENFKINNVIISVSSPLQFADVAVDIGLFCATLIALPLFMYHFFSFANSALTKSESRKLVLSVPISFILFIMGFSYGIFILFYSFTVLAKINEGLGLQNIWDLSSFLSQTITTSALLGLIFQFPLVLSLAVRMGLIPIRSLRDQRRLVILSLFILASLLPPTDGLSLIAMVLPLYLLYEITLLANRGIRDYHYSSNLLN